MSVDKYPPPDDRWVKIGKNAYILPRHKMTKEDKKSLNLKVKKFNFFTFPRNVLKMVFLYLFCN